MIPLYDFMKIVILGLSISSAWGNGHATTYRALCKALHNRKHDIVFFERNVEWYEQNQRFAGSSLLHSEVI